MIMTQDIKTILINEKELETINQQLADKINADYADQTKPLIVIVILKGSLIFASDLVRKINLPLEIEFMKVSSYGAQTVSSGVINIHLDIKRDDLEDVDFLIIEDIVDSGKTLSHLVRYLKERGAASVKTCALLDKPDRRSIDFTADYKGVVIPDKFVVGFGLDYDEKYRNLPFVGVLKPEVYSK